MTVAVVHDHLVQRGGAERLLLSMLRAFPGAPLHTSFFDGGATHAEYQGIDVSTAPIDRAAVLRRHHRLVAPALAPTFTRLKLHEDLVLCSSAGWSHGVTATRGRKLVYFHSPARWLYATDAFLDAAGPVVRLGSAAARRPLLRWDQRAAATIDGFIANSSVTAERIRDAYGVDAPVLPPPVLVAPDGERSPAPGIEPGYVLVVSRLIAYKHVDATVRAFADRPHDRLVIVGDGPERDRLAELAGTNVTLLGSVDEPRLRWLYANARLLVSAAHEDFGLTPLEANAFGCPVAVLRFGGHLDSVRAGTNGVFFDRPTSAEVDDAVERADATTWSRSVLQDHARSFDEARFIARLRAVAAHHVGADALGPEPSHLVAPRGSLP